MERVRTYRELSLYLHGGSLKNQDMSGIAFPAKYFVCVIFLDDTDWSENELAPLVRAAFEAGGVYFVFHGARCEQAHDLTSHMCYPDARASASITPENVILTTWHDDESEANVLGFALLATIPANDYLDKFHSLVFLSFGSDENHKRIRRMLVNAEQTVHDWEP